MLFEADRDLTTFEVLRLLACRGEGTTYAADNNEAMNPNGTAIGNERQAECHVFEIRSDMPDALVTIQWQAMSRAEFSVYLPYYSNLLTDTPDIFKTEYSTEADDIGQVLDDADFPADTSAYWVFAALNDLCDNDRARYGANVKAYWEKYQQALIGQQADVDADMAAIYAESPAKAEQTATALAKAVSEEAFGYAKTMLTELRAFIADDAAGKLSETDVFTPSVLTENKMPAYSVDMLAAEPEQPAEPSEPEQPAEQPEQTTGFTDVAADAWYAQAVQYVVDNSMMNGNGDGTFEPEIAVSRSMLVQVLYNLEGKPEAEDAAFTDVAADAWYADAVAWASGNQIVNGVEVDEFAPDEDITREQMAAILYRYAQYKGYDVSASNDLGAYTDAAQISGYAVPAMQWVNATGLITGSTDTTLSPMDSALRAEAATILMRFAENIAK